MIAQHHTMPKLLLHVENLQKMRKTHHLCTFRLSSCKKCIKVPIFISKPYQNLGKHCIACQPHAHKVSWSFEEKKMKARLEVWKRASIHFPSKCIFKHISMFPITSQAHIHDQKPIQKHKKLGLGIQSYLQAEKVFSSHIWGKKLSKLKSKLTL